MWIDAHQHFWKFVGNESDYVWMTDEYSMLGRDFDPDDLRPLLVAAGFSGTIAVQAREMAKETSYLLELSARHPFILGVVGWLDLCAPDIGAFLDRIADNDKLKGLRMLIHDRADPDFAVSPEHVRGVALLERHGLTYDLLLKPQNLPAATSLADRLPHQMFVVDHIAKPDIRMGILEPWRRQMAEIAKRPNVYCKLSSVITQADWKRWSYEQIEPYLDHVLRVFGADRIMAGSDWPVSTCAADYLTTMSVLKRWAAKLTDVERDAFLGLNCARVYGVAEHLS